jgi:hypothetical protein
LRGVTGGKTNQVTNEELINWAKAARKKAAEVGTLSADWDLIYDAEAHAGGKQTLLDRETVERMIKERPR